MAPRRRALATPFRRAARGTKKQSTVQVEVSGAVTRGIVRERSSLT